MKRLEVECNMKKVLILGMICLLFLVGCGQESAKTEEKYSFSYNNMDFVLGEIFTREKFGTELEYSEVASCAFEGLDKTFKYEHYEITTYPDGEDDRIYSIYLLDDTVSTKEGVKITDDVSKMKEVYGSEYTEQGESYLYSKKGTTLQFYTSNGVIIGIEYSIVIDN